MTIQTDPAITPTATTIMDLLVAISSITAAVLLFLKKVLPKIQEWYKMYTEIKTIIKSLPMFMSASNDIAIVTKEVATNGGTSLKDAVLRSEAAAARIEELISRVAVKQQHLWKNNLSPSFYADSAGLITETNDAFNALVQRDEEQLIRYGWLNCIGIHVRQTFFTEWEIAIKQGRIFEMETILSIDGKAIPVLVRAVPIVISTDLIIGYDGIIKRLEQLKVC